MYQISSATYIFLTLTVILAIVIPVAILIIWKLKTKQKMMPAIVGAVTFVVFALVLEGIPKAIFFTGGTEISKYVLSHAWAYIFLGTLLAGVFEETGRFVAFRIFLKKYESKATSVMYGIGHGGIESVIILGITGVNYIVLAVMMQKGSIDTLISATPQAQIEQFNDTLMKVAGFGGVDCLLAVLERVCAIVFHVSLSILVFKAVKDPKKTWLFPLAIVVHMIFDVPAALYQFGMVSMTICEIWLWVEAALIALLAYYIYKRMKVR